MLIFYAHFKGQFIANSKDDDQQSPLEKKNDNLPDNFNGNGGISGNSSGGIHSNGIGKDNDYDNENDASNVMYSTEEESFLSNENSAQKTLRRQINSSHNSTANLNQNGNIDSPRNGNSNFTDSTKIQKNNKIEKKLNINVNGESSILKPGQIELIASWLPGKT